MPRRGSAGQNGLGQAVPSREEKAAAPPDGALQDAWHLVSKAATPHAR